MAKKIERLAKTYAGISVGTVEDFFKMQDTCVTFVSSDMFDIIEYLDENERLNKILSKLSLPNQFDLLETRENKARIKAGSSPNEKFLNIVYFKDKNLLNGIASVLEHHYANFFKLQFILPGDSLLVCVEDEESKLNTLHDRAFDESILLHETGKLVGNWAIISTNVSF